MAGPASAVGYSSLLQAATGATDPVGAQVLALAHHIDAHAKLSELDIEDALYLLIGRCDRALVALRNQAAPASDSFLSLQFIIGRIIALRLGDTSRCLSFLVAFSVVWPICIRSRPGHSILELVASIEDGKHSPLLHLTGECETMLIRLVVSCFLLMNKHNAALALSTHINKPDQHIVHLASVAYFYRAKALDDNSVVELAISMIGAKLKEVPRDRIGALAFSKGFLLCHRQWFNEAITCFRICIDAGHRRTESSLMLGACFIELGNYHEAFEHLQRSVIDPLVELISAFNVGALKELLGERHEASSIYSTLLEEFDRHIGPEVSPVIPRLVSIRLTHLFLADQQCLNALDLVASMLSGPNGVSLEIARLHVFVLLRCGDRHESALGTCDNYLAIFPNDIRLLLYRGEALFLLTRFTEGANAADAVLTACAPMDGRDSQSSPFKERPTKMQRSGSDLPMHLPYSDVADHIPRIKAHAYSNKGLCLACNGQIDLAISMMQWSLFHYESKEVEFNICMLLMKAGREDLACIRWLQLKGVDLDLPGHTYRELIGELGIVPVHARPTSHVAGALSADQDAIMTKIVLDKWTNIRSNDVFMKPLQETMRSL